ncbi:MAG TPA: methyltransferase [Leptolyngbyaceae cyanobacterium M33_DOE_097]|nr:methyltransferase [Leptolyngbyaceae cyanobacterium M33_DOE_097]
MDYSLRDSVEQDVSFASQHQAFLAKQSRFSFYQVNRLNLITFSNIYHPTPESSSLFLSQAVRKQLQGLDYPKHRLLDLGCGTGVIGLSLKPFVNELHLTDINSKAVLCARINAFINGISAKVYQSDLFNSVPTGGFDIIIFSPPFLQKEIRKEVELCTNDPGGNLFLRFIQEVPYYLSPQGMVFFSYSNLGDLSLLNQIPVGLKLEQLAIERFPEAGTERYAFQLTMQ